MLKFQIKYLSFVLCLLALIPQTSFAFFTGNQKIVPLNDSTVLLSTSYRLSFLNYELTAPILAVRNSDYGITAPNLGYTITTASGEVFDKGKTYSIVLSDSSVINQRYFVPNSKAGEFTLLTILTLSPEEVESVDDLNSLKLRVTTLPFTLKKTGQPEELSQMSQKQLQNSQN